MSRAFSWAVCLVLLLLVSGQRASAIVCDAPCVASGDKVVLATYWHEGRGDHMTVAAGESRTAAALSGYAFVRNEALVFRNYRPGLIPLRLYWHAGRGDNYTEATQAGQFNSFEYLFVRFEGWVLPAQAPGTVPLKLYWHAGRADNMLTATAASEQAAIAAGYVYSGTEGYVAPAP
jgi:hypothetical protein